MLVTIEFHHCASLARSATALENEFRILLSNLSLLLHFKVTLPPEKIRTYIDIIRLSRRNNIFQTTHREKVYR